MLTSAVCLGLAIVLMLAGLPVAIAFGIAGIGMIIAFNLDFSFALPTIFSQINSFVLMAIPFFILAGGLMSAGGLSRREGGCHHGQW